MMPQTSTIINVDMTGKRRYYGFKVYVRTVISKWALYVTTAETDAGQVGLAIACYNHDGTVIDATRALWTTELAGTTGPKFANLSAAYTFEPGEYILGYVTDSTTLRVNSPFSSVNSTLMMNGDGTAATLQYFEGATAATGTGAGGDLAMPAAIGVRTALTTGIANMPPNFAGFR
jgi:hypothetical protein